jgi:hypothetical protein
MELYYEEKFSISEMDKESNTGKTRVEFEYNITLSSLLS